MKDIEVHVVLVVRLHSNLKTFHGKGEKEEKRSGARQRNQERDKMLGPASERKGPCSLRGKETGCRRQGL